MGRRKGRPGARKKSSFSLWPAIQAPSAILMSEDGTVLYEKDADTPQGTGQRHQGDDHASGDGGFENGQITLDEMVTTSAYAASMEAVRFT